MWLFIYEEETPFSFSGWLSPKLLTCLRLAQITEGEREGEREGGVGELLTDEVIAVLFSK